MGSASLPRLWRSLRHTPLLQLLHRARLELKRRWHGALYRLGRTPAAPAAPAARTGPPQPIFAPRRDRLRTDRSKTFLHLLNQDLPLQLPLDWQPPASQLLRVNLHYMEYLEAVDDATFQALVRDWIGQNPANGPGAWRDGWNSYALSLRCLVWMQQLAVRTLPEDFRAAVLTSLAAQLDFLAANLELDLGGNHLLKNLKTLLWARRCFFGFERAGDRAEALLARELERQILPDGLHFERSPAYHLQVFADLLECHGILADGPLRRRLEAKLDAMAQVAVDLCHPDDLPSLFNDGGLHMAYAPAECLDVYARIRGRTPAPRDHFALESGGYYGLRGPGSLLLVDCGALAPDGLPAHGHGDLLGFEWSAAGRRLLVDTGVFEYQEGERRARARSTRAHNTVTVDGADQAEFWKSFRIGRRPHPVLHHLRLEPGRLELDGSHDGFRHMSGRPIHRRRIHADLDQMEVQDVVRGGAGQRVEARLLLHPEVACRIENSGARLVFPGGEVRLHCPHPLRMEAAPWWPDFGVEIPSAQLVLDYGPAPAAGGFLLERVEPPRLAKLGG